MHTLVNSNTQIKANPSSVLSVCRFFAFTFDLHTHAWHVFTPNPSIPLVHGSMILPTIIKWKLHWHAKWWFKRHDKKTRHLTQQTKSTLLNSHKRIPRPIEGFSLTCLHLVASFFRSCDDDHISVCIYPHVPGAPACTHLHVTDRTIVTSRMNHHVISIG